LFGCDPFSLAIGQKSATCTIKIPPMSNFTVGTCGVPASSCYGDTQMYVLDRYSAVLATNDNGGKTGCGRCSYMRLQNRKNSIMQYTVRTQCTPAKTAACGGRVTYALE
jgi:hypothetical protein